jgi:uncharacterized protein (TIGR00290 family)
MRRIVVAWSGGKDSAYALHELLSAKEHEVVGLLTTITKDFDRVSMHGVRTVLIERQAADLGLPLHKVFTRKSAGNQEYEDVMREAVEGLREDRVSGVAFGDIHLEDVRRYRESNLDMVDMSAIFPLWGKDPAYLADQFVKMGFRAVVTCVDTEQLDGKFVGREICTDFLRDLPEKVDPMGENGEFHTFVYNGPGFKRGIQVEAGEKVLRDNRFYYCDIHPVD